MMVEFLYFFLVGRVITTAKTFGELPTFRPYQTPTESSYDMKYGNVVLKITSELIKCSEKVQLCEMDRSEDDHSDYSTVYERTTCEEYTETVCHSVAPRSVLSDDAASSSAPAALKITGPISRGFKHYGPRMRLHSRTGYSLVILPNGIVTVDKYGNNQAGVLEFSSAGIGEVRIRGVQANLYLAMNKHGNLYGEENPRDYATVFVEGMYGQYNTYLSQKYAHNGWYVGIKKNGIIKRGPLTKWGQKAIQFLPIRDDIKN